MGTLDLSPALDRPDLMASVVADALGVFTRSADVEVAPIDATLADTAAFCAAYDIGPDISANCVIVAGSRGDVTRYAACMVLASTRLDVNSVVRKLLDARKASFAPMDDAVALTGMEYGGITPLGIPADWALYVDSSIVALPQVVIGAGIRGAKLVLPGAALAELPGAEVIEGLARELDS